MPDLDSTLAVIGTAIQNEVAGQRFYNDAAFYCIDPWAKEVFSTLAAEEEAHTRLLLAEYESVAAHGLWLDRNVAEARGANVDITRFTFPDGKPAKDLFPPEWSADREIDRRSDDLDALAFGIELERQAIDLYGQAAGEAEDPAARVAYRFLVEEETRHYEELKAQWEKQAGRVYQAR
jgi:rubrerythrin